MSHPKQISILVIAFLALVLVPSAAEPSYAAPAPQIVLGRGTVVSLVGTPHLWFADDRGILHWGGDTRAIEGKQIDWSTRVDLTIEQLRTHRIGDPWLSAGLLKDGSPIYLVKWELGEASPRLFHIQSIADVELFGIDSSNYGAMVLDRAEWENRYPFKVDVLPRAPLPSASGTAQSAPVTATSTPRPAPARSSAPTTYRNPSFGYSLSAPAGWTVLESNPELVILLWEGAAEYADNTTILRLPDAGESLDLLLAGIQLRLLRTVEGFRVVASGPVDIAGAPGRFHEYVLEGDGLRLAGRQTIFRADGSLFLVTSVALETDWPASSPTFRAIEASIEFPGRRA